MLDKCDARREQRTKHNDADDDSNNSGNEQMFTIVFTGLAWSVYVQIHRDNSHIIIYKKMNSVCFATEASPRRTIVT